MADFYFLSTYGYLRSILVMWLECHFLYTEVDGSNPGTSMLCPWSRHFFHIASVDSAVKWVPGGDILMKGVQYYELFGGIALKNHACFLLDLFTFNIQGVPYVFIYRKTDFFMQKYIFIYIIWSTWLPFCWKHISMHVLHCWITHSNTFGFCL